MADETGIKPMTGRERVLAALKREPVDRTPVCNPTSVATVELMDLVDAPFPNANREPELMAPTCRDRIHRAWFRYDHARVLHHPGVVRSRV